MTCPHSGERSQGSPPTNSLDTGPPHSLLWTHIIEYLPAKHLSQFIRARPRGKGGFPAVYFGRGTIQGESCPDVRVSWVSDEVLCIVHPPLCALIHACLCTAGTGRVQDLTPCRVWRGRPPAWPEKQERNRGAWRC